jgi:hypothetical protein
VQGVSPGGQLAATTLTALTAVAVAPWESVTENVTLYVTFWEAPVPQWERLGSTCRPRRIIQLVSDCTIQQACNVAAVSAAHEHGGIVAIMHSGMQSMLRFWAASKVQHTL